MEDSALPLAAASSKGPEYSSCEGTLESERQSFMLCPAIPPIMHRVARRNSLNKLHGFNVFRGRPIHEEFDTSQRVSTMETAINVCNLTVGAGVLVLPFAVQSGGWCVLVALAAYAIWCGASHWMLGELLAEVDQEAEKQGIPRERRGWNVLSEVAMGKVGQRTVECVVWAECVGIIVTYFILAGKCLHIIVPSIAAHVHILCIGTITGALLLVPIEHFAIFGFVGFMAYCMICTTITTTGVELGGWEHIQNQHRSFIIPQQLLRSVGTLNMVYNGHLGSPGFYQAMKDRRSWPTAVSWAMVGVFCFSFAFSAVPYAIFGAASQQSSIENIGRGMDLKILEEPLSKSVNLFMAQACASLVALKLLVTLPSIAIPVVSSLEYFLDVQEGSTLQFMGRVLFGVIMAAVAAAFADELALVVSICGSITNNCVSFLLPSLLYVIIKWESLTYLSRGGLLFLVLFSFVQMVGGLYIAFEGAASK